MPGKIFFAPTSSNILPRELITAEAGDEKATQSGGFFCCLTLSWWGLCGSQPGEFKVHTIWHGILGIIEGRTRPEQDRTWARLRLLRSGGR